MNGQCGNSVEMLPCISLAIELIHMMVRVCFIKYNLDCLLISVRIKRVKFGVQIVDFHRVRMTPVPKIPLRRYSTRILAMFCKKTLVIFTRGRFPFPPTSPSSSSSWDRFCPVPTLSIELVTTSVGELFLVWSVGADCWAHLQHRYFIFFISINL